MKNLEHRRQKPISTPRFALRLAKATGLWFALTSISLLIGMFGYMYFEGMSLVDAFANASMILSGMGPFGELKTTSGKLFAGAYAIFSGLVTVVAMSFILAPIFHRILHVFHVEMDQEN